MPTHQATTTAFSLLVIAMINRRAALTALALFTGTFLIAQVVFSISHGLSLQHTLNHALTEIKTRIALDAAHLDLGDPSTQQQLNEDNVQDYIVQLNKLITEEFGFGGLNVMQIGYESPQTPLQNEVQIPSIFSTAMTVNTLRLRSGHADLVITVQVPALFKELMFNWVGLFFSAVVTGLYLRRTELREVRRQQRQAALPTSYLVIDLSTKQLVNVSNQLRFEMQNKPLCFFAALVQYCIDHPDKELLHHKDVPEELIKVANKVFGRLIELGHTKRKRPDFNANLEKTLSEIRAVLDLVFEDNEKHKALFYPPRAQGEGSRSKQHSYALHKIEQDKVEFIGM